MKCPALSALLLSALLLETTACGTTAPDATPQDTGILPEEASALPLDSAQNPTTEPPETEPALFTGDIATRPAAETPVELPWADSAVFGLEGFDATLYDASMEVLRSEITGDKTGGDLRINALAVLDTYETDDGHLHCICEETTYDYYEIGCYPDHWEEPIYQMGFKLYPLHVRTGS